MKNTMIWLIVAFTWSSTVMATPVTPESFNSGFNSGYSVTDNTDINNNVDWFVFDSNGIDKISFFFDRSTAAPDLVAGLYFGDTTGFDYEATGATSNYSVFGAATYNSDLTFKFLFDDNHDDAFGGAWGDPDFNMLLGEGRYSLALSSYDNAGSYSFRTNAEPIVSAVPVPAAAWLFGSALLGFFGVSRRKARS